MYTDKKLLLFHFFVRDKVQNKQLVVHHIPSSEQITNILIKALSFPTFNHCKNKLKVRLHPT
uniref:Uncharacterized protein n=1 Tax=Cajanus cajan TaxID=3821 RepID=A0A151R0F5_CAJCA|nr:hypothetical protein KK1_042961 [Cajanus cajan]